ncbi:hypothetical protein C8T65DRAFT_762167 [Cerioporus squamosus]|nr:hypothetical protein C8T65DRAFT_762167 [Cerioporus squamosus]
MCRELQYVASLAKFRKLDLVGIWAVVHHATMRVLSSLEHLQVLGVWVDFREMDSSVPWRESFVALESLMVRGQPDHVEKALGMTAPSPLRKLKLLVEGTMKDEDLKSFLDRVRCMELMTFRWTSAPLSIAEILEPVFSLRYIRELTCQFSTYPRPTSAEDIAAISAAWPDLRSLWIICSDRAPAEPHPISFCTLVDLTWRCPRLESLTLANLNVRHLPSLASSSFPRMDQFCMRSVTIHSVVGGESVDMLALAVLTERLFPNLDILRTIRYQAFAGSNLWSTVLNIVAGIQTARRVGD